MNLNPKWDQADYTAANSALRVEIAALESKLQAAGKTAPALEVGDDDIVAANDKLTAHKALLTGLASGSNPTAHASAPTTTTATAASSKEPTLTEKALQLKASSRSPNCRPTSKAETDFRKTNTYKKTT